MLTLVPALLLGLSISNNHITWGKRQERWEELGLISRYFQFFLTILTFLFSINNFVQLTTVSGSTLPLVIGNFKFTGRKGRKDHKK